MSQTVLGGKKTRRVGRSTLILPRWVAFERDERSIVTVGNRER